MVVHVDSMHNKQVQILITTLTYLLRQVTFRTGMEYMTYFSDGLLYFTA